METEHEIALNAKVDEIRKEEARHETELARLNHELAGMILNFDSYTDLYTFTYRHSKNLREFYKTMYLLKPIYFESKKK